MSATNAQVLPCPWVVLQRVIVFALAGGALLATLLLVTPMAIAPPSIAIAPSTADDDALTPANVATATATAAERTRVTELAAACADAAEPPPPATAIDGWIADLRNDHIRGNGLRALRSLCAHAHAADRPLQAALDSFDRQQRQLAAHVLRLASRPATPRLLTVTVETLRRDVGHELATTIAGSIAAPALRWLAEHAFPARAALRIGLEFGDDQQRFLCAFVLGTGGHGDDLVLMTRELVTHLEDNRIDGDALMAAHALYRLGDGARAAITHWRPHVDEQARTLLDLIAADLDAPPRSVTELRARRQLHTATSVYHDPVIEFDLHRSRVATW